MSEASPEPLIRYAVRILADQPEEIQTRTIPLEDGIKVIVRVAESDRGRVIGHGGRTARALRSIVQAAGAVADRRYQVKISDE